MGDDGNLTAGHTATNTPSEGVLNGNKSHELGHSTTPSQSQKQTGLMDTLPLVATGYSDENGARNLDVEKGSMRTKDPVTLRQKRPFWPFKRTNAL